jgi:hypothetical protein
MCQFDQIMSEELFPLGVAQLVPVLLVAKILQNNGETQLVSISTAGGLEVRCDG